jgi:hypothetical protein
VTDEAMQDPLFEQPQPVAPLRALTEKQARGFDLAKTTPGGITADELGAIEHERRGKHHRDQRCDYCTYEGKGVLESVALSPLLVRRRESGRYTPRDGSGAPTLPQRGAQLDGLPDWLAGDEAA